MGQFDNIDYDALAEQVRNGGQPAAPKPASDGIDYDALAAQIKGQHLDTAQATLNAAQTTAPDEAAQKRALAEQLKATFGEDWSPLAIEIPQATKRLQDYQRDQALAGSPKLQQHIAQNPHVAPIVQDDVPNLSAMEQALQTAGATIRAIPAGAQKLASGIVYGTPELAAKVLSDYLGQPLAQNRILPADPFGLAAEKFGELRSNANALGDRIEGEGGDNLISRGIVSGGESVGMMLPGVAAAIITKNPELALYGGAAGQGLQSAGEAIDQGKSGATALMYGVEDAAAEYATEKLPMGVLLKDLKAGAPLYKTIAHQIATEVPTELAATAWQDFDAWANLHPDKTLEDYTKQLGPDEAQTVIATITSSLLMGGGAHGINKLASTFDARQRKAEQDAAKVQEINTVAQQSTTAARSPDTFQQVVKALSEDGPVQDVYIDAKVLAQSELGAKLAEVSPSVAEQLPTAAATGGTVRIPVDEYASRIAPTEYSQQLLDHIKIDPNGVTMQEARDSLQQDLQQEVERHLQADADHAEFMASRDRVKQSVLDELNNAIGNDPNNELRATLIASRSAVRAAQLGLTPEQVFSDQALRVAGPDAAQAQGGVLNQGEYLDYTKRQGGENGQGTGRPADRYKSGREGHDHLAAVGGKAPRESWAANTRITRNGGKELFVAYRGANEPLTPEHFAYESLGKASGNPSSGVGVWSTSHANEARGYGNVEKFYLDLRNPKRMEFHEFPALEGGPEAYYKYREVLRAEGHDGIVLTGKETGKPEVHFVAFDPEQMIPVEQAYAQAADSRGLFNPATNIISLLKNADLSTFLHETGHYFFENDIALAGRLLAKGELATGEQQIVDDVHAMFNYIGLQGGVNDQIRQWESMPFEERVAGHEKMAESFEAYLFDGKAPSIELQPYFQRFAAWLRQVYRSTRQFFASHPEAGKINDDIRQVFDRMLATQDEIDLAEKTRSMFPLFTAEEAAKLGMDVKKYHEDNINATLDSQQNLQARGLRDLQWFHNAHQRQVKLLQKKSDALRREVTMRVRGQVMSQPVYQAWQALASKEGPKLATGVLDYNYANAPEITKRLESFGMVKEDGVHPDMLASQFGFTSGDELVRALDRATPPEQEIEGRVDQEMLASHGELSSPEAIEREADKAIHNDLRARVMATEANALAKAAGQRSIMLKAAKQFATATLARTRVRDLRPGQYATAEARARRNAEKAKGKDLAVAAAEMRNAVLNHYLTEQTYAAQDEVQKIVKYLDKFDSEGVREKLDADYLDQIDALLDRFDLRRGVSLKAIDRRKSLAEWAAAQEEINGVTPDIPPELLLESNRQHYKDMTMDELRGLRDTVSQIEHLARLKHKLLTAADQREFEAIRDEMGDSIEKNAGKRKAMTHTPNTNLGRLAQSLKRFWAAHIKAATMANVLDGGKDGGPAWEYLIRPANAAADKEATMRAEATHKLTEIMAPVLKQGKMGGSGQYFEGIPTAEDRRNGKTGSSFNREARLAIALNVGNESNLQRLLGGEGWTRQQIQPILDTLTKEEWDAVQAVWDHFESYRPEIAAKERRVMGREPEWIAAAPVATKYGEYRGGYYPVKYDPAASQRADQHAEAEEAKQMMKAAYVSATTRRSFTKTRAEEVHGRPLLYSLDGMYTGVSEVIHDLSWHEWLIDANRLLRSSTIDSAIRNHYGPEWTGNFKNWVRDVAQGERPAQHGGEAMLNKLRQNIGVAGLGFNVMTAAMQGLGATQSISRIGAQYFGRGLAKSIGNPVAAAREVQAKSEFMRNRARTRFRELNELQNQVRGSATEPVKRYAYTLMMAGQTMVDVPTWLGAYEKAIGEGNDEARAAKLADQAVIDSQSGGQLKDLSEIERGSPAFKMLTLFYSFMNTTFNMGVMKTMTEKSKAKLAADYLMLFTIPAVMGDLLKSALTPGDDGEDWDQLMRRLLADQLAYLAGLMVIVREFGDASKIVTGAEGVRDYSGPGGYRAIGDVYHFGTQVSQGELDDAFRKSTVNLVGDLAGLPSAQLNRSITGAEAMSDGKTDNPMALIAGYQEPK